MHWRMTPATASCGGLASVRQSSMSPSGENRSMRALNVGQASRGIASRDRSRAVAESATSLNGLAARLSDELAVCVEIFDASAGTLRSHVSELTRAALEEDNADARNLTGILEDCETLPLVTIPCAQRGAPLALSPSFLRASSASGATPRCMAPPNCGHWRVGWSDCPSASRGTPPRCHAILRLFAGPH